MTALNLTGKKKKSLSKNTQEMTLNNSTYAQAFVAPPLYSRKVKNSSTKELAINHVAENREITRVKNSVDKQEWNSSQSYLRTQSLERHMLRLTGSSASKYLLRFFDMSC